jgi:protein gp37
MQKTSIEWCVSEDESQGFTWNPVTGCLGPGGSVDEPKRCQGCYAASIQARWGKTDITRGFMPEFHPGRLTEPHRRRKPTAIFTCSMADLWGEWVPAKWIRPVLKVAIECARHTFIFLTKNPKRYQEFGPYPNNVWIGATARTKPEYVVAADALSKVTAGVRFISAEPLLGRYYDLERATPPGSSSPSWTPDWVIIGDLTRSGRPLGKIKNEWVASLTADAWRHKIPVFHKDSLAARGFTSRELPGGRHA